MIGWIKKFIVARIEKVIEGKISLISPEQKRDFSARKIEVLQNTFVSRDSMIGDYTYIGCNSFITKATIGRYCSIANNVSIGHGEHNLNETSTSSLFYDDPYRVLTRGECVIGNDVWIGVDSIIRRGVKIGNGAVVGANSFVNKDVPDFAIVVGNPAVIIKMRFNTSQIEMINSTNWWDLPFDQAKIIIDRMNSRLNEQ